MKMKKRNVLAFMMAVILMIVNIPAIPVHADPAYVASVKYSYQTFEVGSDWTTFDYKTIQYETLEDALAAAQNPDYKDLLEGLPEYENHFRYLSEVVLLTDVTIAKNTAVIIDPSNLYQGLFIDFNGKTLTVNGLFDGSTPYGYSNSFMAINNSDKKGTLVINKGGNVDAAVTLNGAVDVQLAGGKAYSIQPFHSEASIEMTGGYAKEVMIDGGTVSITGGTVSECTIMNECVTTELSISGTAHIKKLTVDALAGFTETVGEEEIYCYSKIDISGNPIIDKIKLQPHDMVAERDESKKETTIIITGGIFCEDPTYESLLASTIEESIDYQYESWLTSWSGENATDEEKAAKRQEIENEYKVSIPQAWSKLLSYTVDPEPVYSEPYWLVGDAEPSPSPYRTTPNEGDEVKVDFRYMDGKTMPDPTYVTAYYETIEDAFEAIEDADYIDNCPEGSYYYHPLLTLLKDVTINKVIELTLNKELGQIFVEMNGHDLEVADEGGLTGSGMLMFEGEKAGTFINSGNLELGGIYIFNSCDFTVTGGTINTEIEITCGDISISGGEFIKEISIVNTFNDRNITVNISGAAQIRNLSFEAIKDFSEISLNLLGGYYAQDPETFKMNGTKDQSDYVNYDETKLEQYSNQTDWEADTATYTYRIKREVSASSYSKVPAAVTGLVENGSAQALVTAGTAVGGTIKYALGTDATTAPARGWSTNIPTATSAGTYYVWYRLDPDADHTAIAAACITVSIAEKSSEDPNTDPQNDPEDNKEEETPTPTPVPVDNSNDSPFSPVPEITATTESLYLVKGQSFALNETGWTTPDKKTVAVSKKGVVSAKKATGSTPVVLTKKTETAEKTLKIYVAAPSVTKKNTMNAGETFTVTLTSDFKDKLPIFWFSSATDIATVDQSGKVTAVTKGSAVITAQIAGKAYTCKITVKEATVLAERTLHISTGTTTLSLKGVKKPVYSTASSNIVIKGSKVTAENPGTAVVNVKDKEGKDYKINLIIEDPTITSLTAGKTNKYTTELQAGKTKAISFKAYDREAIFKSNKPKVAYVNEKGEIVALSKGKAKLTTKINGKTVTVTVKVTE